MKPAPITTTRGRASNIERAQHERSVEVGVAVRERARRQPPRLGSGRDHETVELDVRAVVEVDAPIGDVERDRAPAEPPVEPEVVDTLLAQRDLLDVPLPGEQLLRERRPVVGQPVFRADRGDAAVESMAPQCLGGPQSCDRDRPHARSLHPAPLVLGRVQPSSVIACCGQTRTASSTFERSSSPGSSWSTYRKLSSRTSKTSGAAAMHSALLLHLSKSTTTRIGCLLIGGRHYPAALARNLTAASY
jgi:hypothetical protein